MESVNLMQPGQDADIEVSWEDQNKINRFSKLNSKFTELEQRKFQLSKRIEATEDAENELELVLEDEEDDLDDAATGKKAWESGVPILIGDCFVNFDLESAKVKLAQMKASYEKEIKGVKKEMEVLDKEMSELKVSLYKRFGASIQLERNLNEEE